MNSTSSRVEVEGGRPLEPPPIPRAVTFDLDGTLYDLAAVRGPMFWKNLLRLRVLRVGRHVREELRTRTFQDGAELLREEARIVGERLDVDSARARSLLDDVFDRTLAEILPRARTPGLRDALGGLASRGVRLAVLSDRRIDDKLRALGLEPELFSARLSADDTGVLKPNPAILRRAARLLGVEVAEITHLGDRVDADGALANAVGARFVHVRSPVETRDEVSRLVRSLDESGSQAVSR